MADEKQSRRGFLKIATGVMGGAIGAVLAYPLLRYVFFPLGERIVAEGAEAIDALGEEALQRGAPPVRVQLTASGVRNAWAVADEVPLGAAWVRKTEDGKVEALSSACPHLGCAIDYDPDDNAFKCPCHKSAFKVDGDKITGPAKRGLDPLPVEVENGRIKITWVRYRPDVPEREPV